MGKSCWNSLGWICRNSIEGCLFGDLRVDFFLSFRKFQGLVFGVEGVFLRRGKGITNNTNRGWRVAKGIITDRSRGISFQSATFWMRVGSCHWIWARDRKRVRRWGESNGSSGWLIFFNGFSLRHCLGAWYSCIGRRSWMIFACVGMGPLSTVSPWPSGISACKSTSWRSQGFNSTDVFTAFFSPKHVTTSQDF